MNNKRNLLALSYLFIMAFLHAQEIKLVSGEIVLDVQKNNDVYHVTFSTDGVTLNTNEKNQLAVISTSDSADHYLPYTSCIASNDTLLLSSNLSIDSGAIFKLTDIYTTKNNGEFEINRTIEVVDIGNGECEGFSSLMGLSLSSSDELLENEYFIPGVWYQNNFKKDANLPPHLPTSTDRIFLYREDRLPLPVVMMRNIKSGLTLTLIHKNT